MYHRSSTTGKFVKKPNKRSDQGLPSIWSGGWKSSVTTAWNIFDTRFDDIYSKAPAGVLSIFYLIYKSILFDAGEVAGVPQRLDQPGSVLHVAVVIADSRVEDVLQTEVTEEHI